MNPVHRYVRWLGLAFLAAVLLSLLVLRPGSASAGLGGGAWRLALLALAVPVVWFWKKRQTGQAVRGQNHLKTVERLRLDPGRVLFLVEADGERLLLATADGGVRLVDRLGKSSSPSRQEQSA